jgi:antirestriction protein
MVENIGMATETPRAWIGCLSCYNNGRLRGKWIDAETAASEHDESVYTYGGQATWGTYPSGSPASFCNECGGDEFDVFDTENVPAPCRTVPSFYDNAGWLAEADADTIERIDALAGWLGGDMSLADLTDYDEEHYCGQWENFQDYAEDYAEQVGDIDKVHEHMRSFVDWAKYADWLGQDYYHDDDTGHIWSSR